MSAVKCCSDHSLGVERSETERLDWVLKYRPEFSDGFLRVRLEAAAAPDGLPGMFMAVGLDARSCIDNALAGFLVRLR